MERTALPDRHSRESGEPKVTRSDNPGEAAGHPLKEQ